LNCPQAIRTHLGLESLRNAEFASLIGYQAVFLWLLLCRLQFDGFLLGRFICGFSMQKLLLLFGWFLFGFFLRGHGNLL